MMECKFCHTESEDGLTVCPNCGKSLTEEPETTAEVTENSAAAEKSAKAENEESAQEITESAENPSEETSAQPTEEATEETVAQPTEEVVGESEAAESEENAEAAPKKKGASAILWILLAVILLAAAFLGVSWMKRPQDDTAETEANAETALISATGRSFTAESGEAANAVVVTTYQKSFRNNLAGGMLNVLGKVKLDGAAQKLGISPKGTELTNKELSLYYWDAFYNFYNQYSYYLSLMGLDPANMDTTEMTGGAEGQTWQEYFLSMALQSFHYQTAVYEKAKAEGFVLPTDYAEDVAAMKQELTTMENIDEQLALVYGEGVTIEDYISYVEKNYYYGAYLTAYQESLEIPEEEVRAYYKENQDSYENSGLEITDKPNVNVRHILIRPTDSTNEASWTEAEKKVNEIYDLWIGDTQSEERFGELAKEYSEDGNASDGGLYSDVYPQQMVSSFNDWCFAEDRKAGDSGIVQTEYGYHIIYFVSATETVHWLETVRSDMVNQKVSDYQSELSKDYKMSFDLDKIAIPLPGQIQEQAATTQESTSGVGVDGMEQSAEQISTEQLLQESAAAEAAADAKAQAERNIDDITDGTESSEQAPAATEITESGNEVVGGVEAETEMPAA